MLKVPETANQCSSLPSHCRLKVVFSVRKHTLECHLSEQVKLSWVPRSSQQFSGRRQTQERTVTQCPPKHKWLWEHLATGQCFGANVSWCFCTNKHNTAAAWWRAPAVFARHNNLGRCRFLTPILESNLKNSSEGCSGSLLNRFQIQHLCLSPPTASMSLMQGMESLHVGYY